MPKAYAIPVGEQWADAYRVANDLMRRGGRVLVAVQDGMVAAGTFVVPVSRTFDPWYNGEVSKDDLQALSAASEIEIVPIDESEGIVAAPARLTRIGLYGGGGAPYNHAAILAACGFPVRFLSDAEVRGGQLAEVDVFVMPGGGNRAMFGQIEPLGETGCRAIADFVRGGGMYIGCCAGSYDCIVNSGSFAQACPTQGELQLLNAGPWRGATAVEFLDLQSPGVGVVTVYNERPDHPVMFGMPEEFPLVHYNGPVLDPLTERTVEGASAAVPLARFTGWTDQFTPAEDFAGPPTEDHPTFLQQAIGAGRYSIAAGEIGLGRVVAFGSHPEFGFDLPMVRWGQPARMFANAVLWQAISTARQSTPAPVRPAWISLPAGSALETVRAAADTLKERARTLQGQSITPAPGWLAPAYAMSVFGLPPDEIWQQSLDQIIALATEAQSIADQISSQIAALTAGEGPLDHATLDRLGQIEQWLLHERPAEWEQDGGFHGVLPLLRTAITMCDTALANWEIELGPPDGPYGYAHENPYHLVAGSYLAAVGQIAGAVQLLHGLAVESRQISQVDMGSGHERRALAARA